jgi:trk system potassium uptake protein TrkH
MEVCARRPHFFSNTNMAKLAGSLERYPARISLYWYATATALGTLLLSLPVSRSDAAKPLTIIDAWFTATSALCVTGLTVRSTGDDFSFFGQCVILALIQIGGIGIMTLTTLVMTQLVGTSLRQWAVVSETLGARRRTNLGWILTGIVAMTLSFELIGAIALMIRFAEQMPLEQAIWSSVFHSVSAFCNAGFGLRNDSLMAYQGDVLVNLTVCLLVILGGLGFPVLIDLQRALRRGWGQAWAELHLHTKLTLVSTGILLVLGAILFTVLEWNHALAQLPAGKRILAPIFHSVSCRTAGFNTVDITRLTEATLFITILLMLVGAGSCSTAGGIKVSTVAMLVVRAWTRFRGFKYVNVCRRTIPQAAIDRAMVSAMFYLLIAGVGITSLLVFDRAWETDGQQSRLFLDSMFECVSALGTVGLSSGATPQLSDVGKFIIIALMFLGRLGPITFFAALAQASARQSLELANEEPLIG